MDVQIALSCLRLNTQGQSTVWGSSTAVDSFIAFTGYGSMQGGSLRRAGDPKGKEAHNYTEARLEPGSHTRSQFDP